MKFTLYLFVHHVQIDINEHYNLLLFCVLLFEAVVPTFYRYIVFCFETPPLSPCPPPPSPLSFSLFLCFYFIDDRVPLIPLFSEGLYRVIGLCLLRREAITGQNKRKSWHKEEIKCDIAGWKSRFPSVVREHWGIPVKRKCSELLMG